MTSFMFYLQIRRVELKNEALLKAESLKTSPTEGDKSANPEDAKNSPVGVVDIKEITKIVSEEWRNLDEGKRKHFNIPSDVQQKLRQENKLGDLESLRQAVLQNVKRTTKAQMESAKKNEAGGSK